MQKNLYSNRQWSGAAVFAGVLLFAVSAPAFASTEGQEELNAPDVRNVQRRVASDEVVLNGRTVLRVPVGSGGLSAAERTEVIRERLEEIAARFDAGAASVTVTQSGADTFVVAVGGDAVATVEPRLARASGAANAEVLAEGFADALRKTLPLGRARQVAMARAGGAH